MSNTHDIIPALQESWEKEVAGARQMIINGEAQLHRLRLSAMGQLAFTFTVEQPDAA